MDTQRELNNGTAAADVCLVMPPVTMIAGPSLALGLLKGALIRQGITCSVDYADCYFENALQEENVSEL